MLHHVLLQLPIYISIILDLCAAKLFPNISLPYLPEMELMTSDKYPHIGIIEQISKTEFLHRHRRQVIAGPLYEWRGNEIPFIIWGGESRFRDLIRRGISLWERATCLRFQENAQASDAIRYVLEDGDSCFTEYIGRSGGYQDIIIGSECAEEYVVAHETGHALGYWHTHQRPDRTRYITVNWNNVIQEATASFMPFRSMLEAFGIRQTSSRHSPYDYGSLMHYHAVAHAIKLSDFTIIPKELKYVTTMGTERLSFMDAKIINEIYCSHLCSGSSLICQAGGYPDPNNCNVCRCPEGLGGKDCSKLQSTPCGAELQSSSWWETLESPHEEKSNCIWRISAPRGQRVRFQITDGEFPCSYGCQSYVEIKHKLDLRLTGFRNCCYRPKEETISDGNQIFVIFHPNGKSAHFTLRYTTESN